MRGVLMLIPVLIWTFVCAILGILIRIFRRADQSVLITGHYFWAPVVLYLLGIKLKITGKENLTNLPSIYVANHTSQLDIPIISACIPRGLFFVAKQELSKIPILGQYMHLMGMIFVDRGNKEKAIQSMEIAAKKVKKGKNLVTFPEGTRGNGNTLLPFKKGSFVIAQKGGIPLIPVAIKGAGKALPKGSFIAHSTTIHVHILAPIMPSEHAELSIADFAKLAQEKIKFALYNNY
jgi:1-acyl-sn-glycerol-3-phosphate acyltransferase